MKREFRLLLTGHDTAFMNMAIDEAIMLHQGRVPPTIRLYGWKPPAVSIGYFQSLEEEVDLEKCREAGVDLIRRITGGGAVFHDNELTYSFITKESDPLVPKEILESYKVICSGIISGLSSLGVRSEFAPLNDIISGGKKISGNAQTRRNHCVLQHGTLLIGVDAKRMFSLLRVPSEKIRRMLIKSAEERVTSIGSLLGRKVSFEETADATAEGFRKSLGIKLVKGELTKSEMKMAKELAEKKYGAKEWNFRR
jgi:lipoate-protein ligase A